MIGRLDSFTAFHPASFAVWLESAGTRSAYPALLESANPNQNRFPERQNRSPLA
jgi:hypothetical protein